MNRHLTRVATAAIVAMLLGTAVFAGIANARSDLSRLTAATARFHSTVQDALMTPQRHVLDAPWQRGRAGGYRLPRRGTSRSLR